MDINKDLNEKLKSIIEYYGYRNQLKKFNEESFEVINKIMNLIKQYGKYDGKKCTRGFQMWIADFNKILDMLKEVSE
jgi:hypothetical protein